MSYRDFFKSWQQDNNISSFFGSDKQQFLADWKEAKKPKTRFGEKIITQPMEIAEPTVSEKVSPNITIAPPKPKRTAAETVLTNPDILKEIGSFQPNAGTRVNAIKIKLEPNKDLNELRTYVKKIAEKDGDSVPSYTAKLILNMMTRSGDFGDWVALDDDKDTVKNALGEAENIEYNKYLTIGEDEGSTITPDLLKYIKSAEKKGLMKVEYKLIKEIADVSRRTIKRPKEVVTVPVKVAAPVKKGETYKRLNNDFEGLPDSDGDSIFSKKADRFGYRWVFGTAGVTDNFFGVLDSNDRLYTNKFGAQLGSKESDKDYDNAKEWIYQLRKKYAPKKTVNINDRNVEIVMPLPNEKDIFLKYWILGNKGKDKDGNKFKMK